jgi:hypothetical protein
MKISKKFNSNKKIKIFLKYKNKQVLSLTSHEWYENVYFCSDTVLLKNINFFIFN